MSLGRKKKSTTKVVKVSAPPPITRVEFNSPTGDRYVTTTQNGQQTFQSYLNPTTRQTVEESLKGLQQLAKELNQPDPVRQQAINQRSRDFFDLQSSDINAQADAQLAKARSSLAKRFGGAYNATFGTNLLAQMEGNRLGQLADASKQAALLGEDLFRADEDSRVRRFALFQNYLADLNNQARGLQSNGSGVLLNESQRATDLAVQKANLALQASRQDALAQSEQNRVDRENALRASSQIAMALMGI
ncbi:hypothetical protein [Vampirovibrio chlorellavorus]|uniref:hypothetical protein n=1 Tax=Vampirovibrio chlorellavorus TaxID=758823 RepID=UPI0026EF21B9|nr:hypothetical protein [Vampirovibrio chlorellavorus]